MKLIEIVANIICNTLSGPDVLDRARLRKGAFARCPLCTFQTPALMHTGCLPARRFSGAGIYQAAGAW